MNVQNIIITNNDRRRLGTMLQSSYIRRTERPDDLHVFEAELENAVGLDSTEVPENVITMNSQVVLRDLEFGDNEIYTVVYPERADAAENRISVLSPLGAAVLGCCEGDVVTVKTPAGTRKIRVEEILYQPERAGEHHV